MRRAMSSMVNATHRIDVDQANRTLRLLPAAAPHTATFFMLHGLGDTAGGWADAAVHLSSSLPHVNFVLPTAPTQPVTLNGGMAMPSWYDIQGLSERSNETCEGLEESRASICALLDAEVAAGIPHDRIVLGGFSQGAALSLYTGLQLDATLAGVVALSGYLPKPDVWATTEASRQTPVLQCHGDMDPMVLPAWAEQARDTMREAGVASVQYTVYPGMAHSANPEEIEEVRQFLCAALPKEAAAAAAETAAATGAGGKCSGAEGAEELRRAAEEAGMNAAELGAEANKLRRD